MNGTEILLSWRLAVRSPVSATHFTFATGRAPALQPPAVRGGPPVLTVSTVFAGRGPERPAAMGYEVAPRTRHVHGFCRQGA